MNNRDAWAAFNLSKRSALDFRPPKPGKFVIGCAKALTPMILKRVYGIISIEYRDYEVKSRQGILKERVLIAPNHPTNAEPAVLFHLSRRVRDSFYYVSNREAFDRWGRIFGAILQRCGAFSILRGAPDRESFRMTRKLMSESPARLVIFPEGEVYSQNDSLLPFHSGVFQLLFFALEDMRKAGVDAPIYVQPVAIKYKFTADISRAIAESLARLERALGIRPAQPRTSSSEEGSESYARLRRIGEAVLFAAEAFYGLEKTDEQSMGPRIDRVKEAIIRRVSDALGMRQLAGELPDRMRTLFNAVHSVSREDVVPESVYEVRLRLQERDRIRPLLSDLNRLANWIAVRDHYVSERPTPERYVETLRRLEIEVLGASRIRGRKRCAVRLAEPFDLREYEESYKADKRAAVQAATSRVETAVQRLLNEMDV